MARQADNQALESEPDGRAEKASASGQKAEPVRKNPSEHPKAINEKASKVEPQGQENIYEARKRLGESLDASRQKLDRKQTEQSSDSEDPDTSSGNSVDVSIEGAVKSNVNAAGRDIYTGATSEQIVAIVDTLLRRLPKINSERSSKANTKRRPKNLEDGFHELDLYDKVCLVLAGFFEGIAIADFDHVFEIIRNVLFEELYDQKEQTNRLYMPLPAIPGLDLIEKFDTEKNARVYVFRQANGAQTVLTLVKERYSKLLYKLVPAIKEVVEQYPNSPEIRVRAAYALGEIATLDISYVYETAIKPFADNNDDGVRATVGYFFVYLFVLPSPNGLPLKKYLHNVLRQWIDSGNWHYRWSAASVCEQMGLFVDDEQVRTLAKETLEKLASTDHIRVARAVIHALVGWSIKQQFFEALDLVKMWTEQGSAGRNNQFNPHEIRCVVGVWAFWAIVIRNSELFDKDIHHEIIQPIDVARTVIESQNTSKDLLPVMTTVAIRSFEFQMGNYFFERLEKWIEIVPDGKDMQKLVPLWLRRIHACFPSNSLHPRHIENRIVNIWLKSKNPKLLAIAKTMQANA